MRATATLFRRLNVQRHGIDLRNITKSRSNISSNCFGWENLLSVYAPTSRLDNYRQPSSTAGPTLRHRLWRARIIHVRRRLNPPDSKFWRGPRRRRTGRSWTTDAGPRSSPSSPRRRLSECECSCRGWRPLQEIRVSVIWRLRGRLSQSKRLQYRRSSPLKSEAAPQRN